MLESSGVRRATRLGVGSERISSNNMDRKSSAKDSLTYRILREDDADVVVKFLQKHFIPFEPLEIAAGVRADEEKAFPYIIIKNSLWQGVSIGIFDNTTGDLCAIRINMLGKNNDALPEEDHNHMHSEKQQMVHRILGVIKGGDLKEIAGSENYMEHIFVTVDQGYARRGIATELYYQSEILAKENGCKKLIVVCSNKFTRRSVEKVGYTLLREIKYEDYTDQLTGEKAFAHTKAPHDSIVLMTKTLM